MFFSDITIFLCPLIESESLQPLKIYQGQLSLRQFIVLFDLTEYHVFRQLLYGNSAHYYYTGSLLNPNEM